MKTDTDRNRDGIRRHIVKRYLETGRQSTLVICQQNYQEWLAGSDIPDNIHIEHFNAVAGLDQYKDVRLLISIGRTLPGPEAVENIAAALTGREPVRVAGQQNARRWYVPQIRGASIKGRTMGKAVQCDTHPDPVCEAIRFQICEAEIVQAIGRGRGVNRTAETPLDLDIIATVVLPVQLDEISIWRAPTTVYESLLAGVLLTNRGDMVKCFPEVWPNEEAAKRALLTVAPELTENINDKSHERSDEERGMGHSSIKNSTFMGLCPTPHRTVVDYQPVGAGQKLRHAYFDTRIIPEPKAWIEERLGSLAAFKVIA